MKLLVLGSGLMGPAAAYNAASDPEVAQVVLCDRDQGQLEAGIKKFVGTDFACKMGVVRLDLENQTAAADLISKLDVVVAALPQTVSPLAIRAALLAELEAVNIRFEMSGEGGA